MEKILAELDSIAEQIGNLEDKRKRLSNFLREIKNVKIGNEEILESRLSIPVQPSELDDYRITGVDGGLVKRAYHAIDLVLTKAVAASFDYRGGLENVSYLPEALPTPRLSVFTEPLSSQDFSLAANLERMGTELDLLLKALGEDPDLLLLDGSIVPHPSSRPRKDSPVYDKFEEVVEKVKKVFRRSQEVDCFLAGVSEDSRAKRFAKIVSKEILSKIDSEKAESLGNVLSTTRDTNLLFHVLKEGERTFCFTYSSDPEDKSLPLGTGDIYSFYLKTTDYDRPIRVDFYSEKQPVEAADKIASLLLPVSSQNKEYGIPVMLVEADSRAKLREEELSFIYHSLQDKVGDVPSLYKLRRDKRPF